MKPVLCCYSGGKSTKYETCALLLLRQKMYQIWNLCFVVTQAENVPNMKPVLCCTQAENVPNMKPVLCCYSGGKCTKYETCALLLLRRKMYQIQKPLFCCYLRGKCTKYETCARFHTLYNSRVYTSLKCLQIRPFAVQIYTHGQIHIYEIIYLIHVCVFTIFTWVNLCRL